MHNKTIRKRSQTASQPHYLYELSELAIELELVLARIVRDSRKAFQLVGLLLFPGQIRRFV
jgi:hypothetical protein